MRNNSNIIKNYIIVLSIIIFIMLIIGFLPPFNYYGNLDSELFSRYGSFIGGLFGSILSAISILFVVVYNEKQLVEVRKQLDEQKSKSTYNYLNDRHKYLTDELLGLVTSVDKKFYYEDNAIHTAECTNFQNILYLLDLFLIYKENNIIIQNESIISSFYDTYLKHIYKILIDLNETKDDLKGIFDDEYSKSNMEFSYNKMPVELKLIILIYYKLNKFEYINKNKYIITLNLVSQDDTDYKYLLKKYPNLMTIYNAIDT